MGEFLSRLIYQQRYGSVALFQPLGRSGALDSRAGAAYRLLDHPAICLSADGFPSFRRRGAFLTETRYFAGHAWAIAFLTFTGFSGFSSTTGVLLIASTTSIPFVTRPKAANFPSRDGASLTRMKKSVVA